MTATFICVLFATAASAADPWVVYDGSEGPGSGKHVVLVSGDEEYRSEEGLPQLGKILAMRHGFKCTVLFSIDPETGFIDPDNTRNIPGLEALQSADLMIIATRFRDLPDEQMKYVAEYLDAGKPVLGMRAAVVAFRLSSPTYERFSSRSKTWEGGFGRQILGQTWMSHHGLHGRESTRGLIAPGAEDHPIVRGCDDVWGPTDVYEVRDTLANDSDVLMLGQVLDGMQPTDKQVAGPKNDPMMPIAWTRSYRGPGGKVGRVFTTTMGAATDLESEGLRRLLVNAVYWCVGLENEIPARANVDVVGEFKPSPFGFGKFKKDIKPSDHAMLPEAKPYVVQNVSGYNSWPMVQAIGETLVCVYSRGTAHSIGEDARAVYARTSADNGKTWTKETVVASTPRYGEVAVGKGLDGTGAMFLWVRRIGKEWNHDLYRTTDGVQFALVATPKLAVTPVQITDIFTVPTVGLMALWFAGDYRDNGPSHSWGTLTSSDNGATWVQTTVESKLPKLQWPTEPSAVYLGNGRLLAIARIEGEGAPSTRTQFQIVSTDYGATWTRAQTNIADVSSSTPSLILDADTGLLSNYYYQRGRGILRRRVVDPDGVFDHPLDWPVSEAVATGSRIGIDSGNVNATTIKGTHYLAFYSGEAPDTAILLAVLPAPRK